MRPTTELYTAYDSRPITGLYAAYSRPIHGLYTAHFSVVKKSIIVYQSASLPILCDFVEPLVIATFLILNGICPL
jgi:hypothetical protein